MDEDSERIQRKSKRSLEKTANSIEAMDVIATWHFFKKNMRELDKSLKDSSYCG